LGVNGIISFVLFILALKNSYSYMRKRPPKILSVVLTEIFIALLFVIFGLWTNHMVVFLIIGGALICLDTLHFILSGSHIMGKWA